MQPDGQTHRVHASAVSLNGSAVLISGASGSGKSTLALQLMAWGAGLIADDRTDIVMTGGWPHAACPSAIQGRIEARGIGILTADPAPSAPIRLAVDMDLCERSRLPDPRYTILSGCRIRLLHRVDGVHFAPAVLQCLRTALPGKGRHDARR